MIRRFHNNLVKQKIFLLKNNKSFVILIFFLSCHITRSCAQIKISGTIVGPSGNRIGLATIRISSISDPTLFKAAVSDSSGQFHFDNITSNNYRLNFSHISYLDTTIILNKKDLSTADRLEIRLRERKIESLNAVTITGKKPLVQKLIDRTVFNVENSAKITGGDALDALRATPGVIVNGNNSINLVGKSGVKILINDRPTVLSGEDLIATLKALSADNISKIEVITNPPAKYDAAGNSGLINIVLKKNKTDGISGNVMGSGTQATYKSYNAGGQLSYHSENISVTGNINNVQGDFLRTSDNRYYYPSETWADKQRSINSSKKLSGSIGLDIQLTDNSLIGFKYNGLIGKDTTRSNSNTDIFDNSGILKYTINTHTQRPIKSSNNDFNVHFENKNDKSGRKLTMDADYFTFYKKLYQSYISSQFNADATNQNNGSNVQSFSPQSVKLFTLQTDVELPTKILKMSFGGKVSFINNVSDVNYYNIINSATSFDTTKSNNFKYSENTQAIYFSGNKNVKKWSFQVGLRGELTQIKGYSEQYDQLNRSMYLRLFPTLYISYKIDENNQVLFNYGRRINRPEYFRLNPFRLFSSPYTYSEGNPFLAPSYSNNYELSYVLKENFTTSLVYSHQTNGFDQIGIPDTLTKVLRVEQLNFLTLTSYGLSQYYTFSPLPWFESYNQFQVYYNVVLSSNVNTQRQLKGWSSYLSTDNTFFFNSKKSMMATMTYWYQFPEVSGIDRNTGYMNVDIGFRFLFAAKKLSLGIVTNDILRTNKFTIQSLTNGVRQDYNNYFDNRKIRLSMSYKFGSKAKIARQNNNSSNNEEKSRSR